MIVLFIFPGPVFGFSYGHSYSSSLKVETEACVCRFIFDAEKAVSSPAVQIDIQI